MKKNFLKMLTVFGLLIVSYSTYGQIDCDCDFEFDPVCVEVDNGDILPFPNACFAECEGFTEDDFVDCDLGGWPGNDCDCELDPEDEPVCVEIEAGIIIPFPNACFAECEGFTEEDFVECEGDWPGNDCDCELDPEDEPVCVVLDNGDILPFPNACFAECEGFTEEDFVECEGDWPGNDCDCELDPEDEPVCVLTAEDVICVFPNLCFAECAGYSEEDIVECDDDWPGDCDCDDVFDPVCVEIEAGVIIPFPNACFAECEGFTEDDFVDCEDDWPGDCVCPEIFDPVCILTDDGFVLTFQNACYAECEGYGEEDFVECDDDPWNCDCDDDGEIVCVEVEEGIVIPFPNECWANCFGFMEDSFVDCSDLENTPIEELSLIFDQNDSGFNGNNPSENKFGQSQSSTIDKAVIYPNPVQDLLQIKLNTASNTDVQIKVFSITGKVVVSSNYHLEAGPNTIRLNANEWPSGIYITEIQTEENKISLKFVK